MGTDGKNVTVTLKRELWAVYKCNNDNSDSVAAPWGEMTIVKKKFHRDIFFLFNAIGANC